MAGFNRPHAPSEGREAAIAASGVPGFRQRGSVRLMGDGPRICCLIRRSIPAAEIHSFVTFRISDPAADCRAAFQWNLRRIDGAARALG